MTTSLGWEAQLGWGEETTWGTAGTINRFLYHLSESLRFEEETLRTALVRGTRSQQIEQAIRGKRAVSGPLAFVTMAKGLGLWFKHGLGAVATSTPAGGILSRLHAFTLADALPVGLSVEAKKAPARFHKYLGCLVNELTLTADVGEVGRLSVDLLGRDEVVAGTGATATYPSGNEQLVFHQGVFKIAGVQVDVRSFELRVANNLFAEDYRTGSKLRQSLKPKMRVVGGRVRVPYNALPAGYDDYLTFATKALNFKFTGSIIEGALNNFLEVDLPNVKYIGKNEPPVGAPDDEVLLEIEFEAYKSGGTSELTLNYQNAETAP